MRNAIFALALALATLSVAMIGRARSDSADSLPADVGAGRVAWFDLTTTDLARSKGFYSALFAWKFTPVAGTELAVEIVSEGKAIGTLRGTEGKISAYNGVVYVQVTDLRASCAKSQELGGTIVPGFPFDLPNGTGAISLVMDPAGHPFGMYSRTALAPAKPEKPEKPAKPGDSPPKKP